MAHYRLIHEYTTPQFHYVCGRVFNEDGKEVAIHTSSNLAWLKSLRPSWKPSEAQLMALHSVIDDESDTIGNEQLKLLYNDLRKL